MENTITLDEALVVVRQLSPIDKARLIERLVPDVERELKAAEPKPRKSLLGLWHGLDITEEDIQEARQEMWSSFPREDI